MKHIYIGHATRNFDYKRFLYEPLKSSDIVSKYKCIFPHDEGNNPVNSEELIKNNNNDLIMIADLTMPSTGLGIELAWAREAGIPVIFVSQKGVKITNTPKYLWSKDEKQFIHIEYKNGNDLVEQLCTSLNLLLKAKTQSNLQFVL